EPKTPEKGEAKAPKKGEPKTPEKGEMKPSKKGEPKTPEQEETKAPEQVETEIQEDPAEMEKNLILRFQIHEFSQQNVTQVFSFWDRVQGTVELPMIEKGNKSQPSAENKGQKTSKPLEKVEKKSAQKRGGQSSPQSSQLETQSKAAEEAVRAEHVGVPCLDIQVTDPKAMFMEILRSGRLPTEDEMLRHLGLHPEGPPLPPAVVLSLVNYPEERLGSAEHVELFTIEAPEGAAMEDDLVASRAGSWEGSWYLSHQERLWLSDCTSCLEHLIAPLPPLSLPRLVFPQWRKSMEADEIIFKEYVESTEQFHFGPLLCGKSREWYVLPAGPCTF
ncbi:HYDIN protein, partial [Sylvia borin]|nr:HYDIN protein [Sylvia borin]